jgi:hypothetical protein
MLKSLTGLFSNDRTNAPPLFQPTESLAALEELRSIVMESDISPFEVNHSGLIQAILQYITQPDNPVMGPRDQRLRTFLYVFAGCPVSLLIIVYMENSFSVLSDYTLFKRWYLKVTRIFQ